MGKDTRQNEKEKRNFFRVNHEVFFEYKPVDVYTAENLDAHEQFEENASLALLSEIKRLDRDNIQTLKLLCDKNRLLGEYLQSLSKKIDLLARHSILTSSAAHNGEKTSKINLSEDGFAFSDERAFYKDSYIGVRLIFLPNYAPVTSFAKVLRCSTKDDRYHVAAKFFRLSESDRQELSRQIMKAQVKLRKTTHTKKEN